MSDERAMGAAGNAGTGVASTRSAPRPARVPQAVSPRARVLRHAERAQLPDATEAILRAGRVAHVGFVVDGQPFVLPFTYFYDEGKLYLHGSRAGRTMAHLRTGAPVCVEVTLLDGLVASREAEDHSANYRSAVVFGRAETLTDFAEIRAVFARMTERYFPGRMVGRDYEPVPDETLLTTSLVAITVEETSGKVRSGPPNGPRDGDDDAPGSAFVAPLPGLNA